MDSGRSSTWRELAAFFRLASVLSDMRRPLAAALLVALTLVPLDAARAAQAPHAPTHVTVSAPDFHDLSVSWHAEPRTIYQVRWRPVHGRWRTKRAGTNGHLRLRGLHQGATYQVQVRGCRRS